jgi:hypothetical protein
MCFSRESLQRKTRVFQICIYILNRKRCVFQESRCNGKHVLQICIHSTEKDVFFKRVVATENMCFKSVDTQQKKMCFSRESLQRKTCASNLYTLNRKICVFQGKNYLVCFSGLARHDAETRTGRFRTFDPNLAEMRVVAVSGDRPDKLMKGEPNMWEQVRAM